VTLVLLLMGVPRLSRAAVIEHRGNEIVFCGDTFALAFSDANGSIHSVTASGKSGSALASDDGGLWQVGYEGGGGVEAADFSAGSLTRPFRWSADRKSVV
jgi:hypothetical protein